MWDKIVQPWKRLRAAWNGLRALEKLGTAREHDELRSRNIALAEENSNLRQVNARLAGELERERSHTADLDGLRFIRNVYWGPNGDPPDAEGPFCPRCITKDRVRMPLQPAGNGYYWCSDLKACGGRYKVFERDTPPPTRRMRHPGPGWTGDL